MNSQLQRSTGVFEFPAGEASRGTSLWRDFLNLLSHVWSSTGFEDELVTQYAEDLMLEETRRGIRSMALLSLAIQITAVFLYQKLGVHGSFLYTYGLLSALSVHVVVSLRFVSDIRALNLLGSILLIITGIAIMTIAHRSGSINAGLLSSIVLLFMVMPIVPWGLREALTIVGLTYVTFTFSLLSVAGRFESDTLWTVQFLILASAATAVLTIVRNTIVRKDDIRVRYELEDAHRELQLISTRDPLTGAWNRRFIEQNFDDFAQRSFDEGKVVRLALLDIDRFKQFNDTYGHHQGDTILQQLTNVFIGSLPGNAFLIRLGGDEFAILSAGECIEQLVDRCLNHLSTDPLILQQCSGESVTVTKGFAYGSTDKVANLTELYKQADAKLYDAKDRQSSRSAIVRRAPENLVSTGAMRIGK